MFRKITWAFMLVHVLVVSILGVSKVLADASASTHGPIGVMAEHRHKPGEWMVSYRYMRMDMDDNYIGSDKVATGDVHAQFPVAPTSMDMQMHMLGGMYGLSDRTTLMVMVPYIEQEMDHRLRNGREFSTRSNGIGDVKFSGIIGLFEDNAHTVDMNLGISFPTGSINQRDATPVGPDPILPYPMQLGSGTHDFHPGLTYVGRADRLSWGLQFSSVLRWGHNARKYRLGNRYEATGWLAYEWAKWISTSVRLKKSHWGDIDGADPDLNTNLIQTADPTRQGGRRLDLLFGVNLIGTKPGPLYDHRLAVEVGFPVYVDLDGPQLNNDLHFTVGWQKAF